MPKPVDALVLLKELLKRGGTITVFEGVREPAIAAGIIDPDTFDAGIRALYRAAEGDGVFCDTFFKGVGRN